MEYTFSVSRRRSSATQGAATVLLNGVALVDFGDTIELIKEGQPFYGENIGGWASVVPDGHFVHGLLFHPYEDHAVRVRTLLKEEGVPSCP